MSKSGFLFEQLDRIGHALAAALLIAAEDHERGLDIAGLDGIVELVAIALEFCDVAGVEITARAVDGIEIAVEDQAREMIVERRAPIVFMGDDVGYAARDVVFLFGGRERRGGRGGTRGARGVMAAPNSAASPTALAQTAMPVIQRERLALGLLVITVPFSCKLRSPIPFKAREARAS